MAETLLETKFHIASNRPERVSRQRLIKALNEGLHRKLTLVSAPAGFGKTTLVTEWIDTIPLEVERGNLNHYWIAWFSIDEGDNDLLRFLSYFVTAIIKMEGFDLDFGRGVLSMLQSAQPPPSETVLSTLINEITTIPGNILIVLDDYHLIEVQSIHNALIYFLEHLPPQVHLVIASRENPNLQLARLRARDQLTELRATDLRFTSSEASEFLNNVMKLNLKLEDIRKLTMRTEGWVTGLQLAGISLRGCDDPISFIESFSGSHRFVLDYLIEEILEQQPDNIRSFLLKTSILERMTGSLCDALTGQDSGEATLKKLEHANLFIVPLDEERCWYRYHHLFSDLLSQHLLKFQQEELSNLHQRAIEWYEQNGLVDEAIEHALHAEEFEGAASLVEKHIDTIWEYGEYAKLRRWLVRLPDELMLSSPKLSIFRAWEFFATGQLERGEKFLQTAELFDNLNSDQLSGYDSQSQNQTSASNTLKVRGRAAAIQAWMTAYRRHNIPGLIQHLSQALENLPEQDVHWRSALAITLADTHAFNGDLSAAYQVRLDALKACETAGNTYLFTYNSAKLAINLKAQGRLLQVKEFCQQRVQFANECGMSQTAVVGWLLAIWAEVMAELNELDKALDLAKKSIRLTEHGGDVVIFGWSCLSLTRILFSRGDIAGAESIVRKLSGVARESSIVPTWIMKMNAAWQSRIWLAKGNLETAFHWMSEQKLDFNKKPTHIDGMEYIGFVRVLILQGKLNESMSILESLITVAHNASDITREIELLILQAFAFESSGDLDQALATCEKALKLGEPRGFYRIFVDEGAPMAHLLYEALSRDISPNYVRSLLAAFPVEDPEKTSQIKHQEPDTEWIEPLSVREIEILQLINKGLTNQEISTRLFLSLHTVKTHIRNIYSKLHVHNRTQAIAKAKVLGILQSA